MESQELLFASYEAQGWKVDRTSVRLVSKVDNIKKYDVNVVSPDQVFGTAQFVEDGGLFTAQGFWKEQTTSFTERLRSYVRGLEGAGGIFTIVVKDTYEADLAALVTVYIGTTDVTPSNYIVVERNNVFSYRLVV